MLFEFRPPGRLLFGEGAFNSVGDVVAEFGKRPLVVTGRRAMQATGVLDRALGLLRAAGTDPVVFSEIPPNPTVEAVDAGAAVARQEACDVVLGLGGGSSMDAAKAIAVAGPHDRPIRDFMVAGAEGKPAAVTAATLPVICATSTAGTASELTPFAVLTIGDLTQKSAIRNPFILPRVALEDPELTYTASPEITAATGIDVLCHALESYISNAATPLTDLMAQEAIRLVGVSLPRAYADGQDVEARRQMMLANALAGYGLACCGATVMHGLEHPVSAYYPEVAHGRGLAVMIRPWARLMWQRMPDRFRRIAELLAPASLAGSAYEHGAEAAEEVLSTLLEQVGLDLTLADLGVDRALLPTMAQDTCRYMAATLQKTPGTPECPELLALLEAAY